MPGECWTVKEIESLITQVAFEKRRLPDLYIPGRGEAVPPQLEMEGAFCR